MSAEDYEKDVRAFCAETEPDGYTKMEHVEPEDPCPVCKAIKARDLRVRAEAFEEAARILDSLPSNPRFLGEILREKATALRRTP